MQIAQKVFVVTGGGNGIGREVVRGLITRGARVAAADISESALAETTRLAAAAPGRLTTHVLNVAGIVQRFARVQDLGFEEIERVMAVNFWGVVNTTKVFLPLLLQRPEACLVNVSSMGALVPVPGQSTYGASKAAVKLLTEALYAELRDSPVAVSVVFPGAIETDIVGNSGVGLPSHAVESHAKGSKRTSPATAAEQIIKAVEKGSYRVRIGSDALMLDRLSRLMPQRATTFIADKMKSLLGS